MQTACPRHALHIPPCTPTPPHGACRSTFLRRLPPLRGLPPLPPPTSGAVRFHRYSHTPPPLHCRANSAHLLYARLDTWARLRTSGLPATRDDQTAEPRTARTSPIRRATATAYARTRTGKDSCAAGPATFPLTHAPDGIPRRFGHAATVPPDLVYLYLSSLSGHSRLPSTWFAQNCPSFYANAGGPSGCSPARCTGPRTVLRTPPATSR